MFGSIPIGRVFGITVRVHWMWLVGLILIALFWPVEPLATLIYMLVLFGVVLLHELGHSLMARAFRIHVLDITLWPLGGLARMSDIPESPKVEALIAVAGPAVNFVLAMIATPVLLASGWLELDGSGAQMGLSIKELARNFLLMNLAMGVFNLVPAFPMDGGRVLRAFLGLFSDWLTATKRAVAVGKLFAVLMIVSSFVFGWWALMIIGLFIWWQGSAELFGVRVRHGDVPGFVYRGPKPAAFTPQAPPVERDDGPEDPSGARKPGENPLEGARGPLSKDDIEKLENYRGTIRPPRDPGE